MNNTAIKVENLSKIYRLYDKPQDRLKEALHPFKKKYHHDFHALDSISFEVKKGETVGIIGKNGAGKSTLLKIITGVLTPTTGSVKINGKVASLLELGAGFNPEMTGLENIYLNGTLMGFTKEEMDQRIDAITEFANIGEFIYQPVKMYSSGMFARLAFSVAINVDADILIVDEALSVGDMLFQAKCMTKMTQLMKEGMTILFVSHDIHAVRSLCQTGIYLENGKTVMIGEAGKVVDRYINDDQQAANMQLKEMAAHRTYSGSEEAISFTQEGIPIKVALTPSIKEKEGMVRHGAMETKGLRSLTMLCSTSTLTKQINLFPKQITTSRCPFCFTKTYRHLSPLPHSLASMANNCLHGSIPRTALNFRQSPRETLSSLPLKSISP